MRVSVKEARGDGTCPFCEQPVDQGTQAVYCGGVAPLHPACAQDWLRKRRTLLYNRLSNALRSVRAQCAGLRIRRPSKTAEVEG